MDFKISHKTISSGYFALCMVSLILFMCIDMFGQEHGSYGISGAGIITSLTLVILIGASFKFIAMPHYAAYKPDTTILLYILYILWTIIIVITNDRNNDTYTFTISLVKHTIPIFSILIPFNYLQNHKDSKIFGWFFCISSLAFALCYFKIMATIISENISEAPHMIISYYTLYILPLILLTCSNKLRIFFVIFTATVLTTSIKRGGIVAMGLGLIVYAFVYVITTKKIKLSTFITAICSLAILVILFLTLADTDENDLIKRFSNMENDDGSGRTIVWSVVINLILNSDFMPFLFGHGYNAVSMDASVGLSAHNDFLEVIYDYGLIGLTLYVCAVISLICKTISHIIKRTQYAAILAMFITIYMTLSMISHIVIYTWFNLIMLTVGYISGRERLDARNK